MLLPFWGQNLLFSASMLDRVFNDFMSALRSTFSWGISQSEMYEGEFDSVMHLCLFEVRNYWHISKLFSWTTSDTAVRFTVNVQSVHLQLRFIFWVFSYANLSTVASSFRHLANCEIQRWYILCLLCVLYTVCIIRCTYPIKTSQFVFRSCGMLCSVSWCKLLNSASIFRIQLSAFGLLDPEEELTTLFWNVSNNLKVITAWHHRRLESLLLPLVEPQILCESDCILKGNVVEWNIYGEISYMMCSLRFLIMFNLFLKLNINSSVIVESQVCVCVLLLTRDGIGDKLWWCRLKTLNTAQGPIPVVINVHRTTPHCLPFPFFVHSCLL
jgi:hypothetical protein